MENNNITVTILKKVNLPKRINGKDLYQFLEADPEKETVLLHYQYSPSSLSVHRTGKHSND